MLILLTGFVQVALVSANTVQISHGRLFGSYLVGFAISCVWAWNVHHLGSVSGVLDGFLYAQGAGLGTVAGMLITRRIYGR